MHSLDALRIDLLRLKYHATALAFVIKLRQFERTLKANFNPDQPRVPAGNPTGGRWTDEDWGSEGSAGERGDDSLADFSATRRRGRSLRRWIGDRLVEVSLGDQIRLDSYESQANAAIARAREVDPS